MEEIRPKFIIGSIVVCLLLLIVSFPISSTSSTTGGVETIEITEEGGFEFGEPYVFLTKIRENLSCVGAMANGIFPFKFISRLMKCEIVYDMYNDDGERFQGSYSEPQWQANGMWILQRGVKITNFHHGHFWGYVYENGVLKDSDYKYYTASLMV